MDNIVTIFIYLSPYILLFILIAIEDNLLDKSVTSNLEPDPSRGNKETG